MSEKRGRDGLRDIIGLKGWVTENALVYAETSWEGLRRCAMIGEPDLLLKQRLSAPDHSYWT